MLGMLRPRRLSFERLWLWVGRRVARGERGGIEIVDRDDARHEIADSANALASSAVSTPLDLASSIQSLL